jgi:hypothetical protein
MRLTWRDAVASLFVAAAVIAYVLWAAGVAMTTVSSTGIGLVVFGSGWAACVTNRREMATVYGVDRTRPGPTRVYVVAASILGAMALIAGIATLFTRSEPLLLVLVGAVVAFWLLATARHAFGSRTANVNGRERHLDRAA